MSDEIKALLSACAELESAERRLDGLSDAVKDNDRLRAELDEAVKALVWVGECCWWAFGEWHSCRCTGASSRP